MPRLRTVIAAAATTLAVLAFTAGPASAATTWTTTGSDHADALTQSQGLATIVRPGGTQLRYTGVGTIPVSVRVESAAVPLAFLHQKSQPCSIPPRFEDFRYAPLTVNRAPCALKLNPHAR